MDTVGVTSTAYPVVVEGASTVLEDYLVGGHLCIPKCVSLRLFLGDMMNGARRLRETSHPAQSDESCEQALEVSTASISRHRRAWYQVCRHGTVVLGITTSSSSF